MYLENCDTVLPMKKQTIVVRKNEIGMSGPAFSAMTGNVNTMLSDGAMCVMPWNTTCGRPRAPRRSCGALEGLAVSAVKGRPPCKCLHNRFRKVLLTKRPRVNSHGLAR